MLGQTRSSSTARNTRRPVTRRGTRWGAIVAVMVVFLAAFAVAAVAGVIGRPPVTGPLQTLTHVGPTPDLTAVANGLSLRHKSLTTLITIRPGLALTRPVEISIGYYSPAGTNRITQSYVASTGNRFLYNDREGDGKPRQLRMDITLRQDKPGGGGYTFAISWQANLDPLYDVTISPLKFTLVNDCDSWPTRDSEIRFQWYSPDSPHHLNYSFSTGKLNPITINQFKWSRAEVSAFANLRMPALGFWESDRGSVGAVLPAPPKVNLVPGKSRLVRGNLQAMIGGPCVANFEYPIAYQLRWYPYLDASPPAATAFGWTNLITTANTTEPVGTRLGSAEDTIAGNNIRDIVTNAQVKVRPDSLACQACHITGGSRPAWDARNQTKAQFCGRVSAFNGASKPQILKNLLNNWGSRGCPD